MLPTMGGKMEAKYLEMLYVTELMLLTIGLSGSLVCGSRSVHRCKG